MAGAHLGGDRAGHFEHTDHTADIVGGARTPCIAVAAGDHHLAGELGAGDDRERVPDRVVASLSGLAGERHAGASGPGPRGSGTATRPARTAESGPRSWRHCPRCRRVRCRCRGDRAAGAPRCRRRSARPGCAGCPSGRDRRGGRRRCSGSPGAGVTVGVHDAAALHALFGAHGSFGVHVAAREAIVGRIAVDEERGRAVLLGFARLDAAERVAVAGDDDLALHRDADRVEVGVVLNESVIDVHDLAGRASVPAVGVERRDLGKGGRRGVTGDRSFAQRQLFRVGGGGRAEPRDVDGERLRHVDIVGAHLGRETPALQLGEDQIAGAGLGRSPGHVRLVGEGTGQGVGVRRVGRRDDVGLEGILGRRARGRVAGERLSGRRRLRQSGYGPRTPDRATPDRATPDRAAPASARALLPHRHPELP